MDIYATFDQMDQLACAIFENDHDTLYRLALHVEDCMSGGMAYFSLLEDEDDEFISFDESIHDLRWMAELVQQLTK